MRRLLAHPLTLGLDIDDPRTTALRRQIIRKNPFLRRIYEEWYTALASALPTGQEVVLELGSGAGFLPQFVPHVITSEVFFCPDVRIVLDGHRLPFPEAGLRGIVMTDVLHHLSEPRRFLREATRCVRPAGVIAMIEPWVSVWSRLVYGRLHQEPFLPASLTWEFPDSGPLSGANSAMPWIIFERDRSQFENEFPEWQIETIKPMMPFRYLVSGGVSMRNLMPGFTFGFWGMLEKALQFQMKNLAMFAQIIIRRV